MKHPKHAGVAVPRTKQAHDNQVPIYPMCVHTQPCVQLPRHIYKKHHHTIRGAQAPLDIHVRTHLQAISIAGRSVCHQKDVASDTYTSVLHRAMGLSLYRDAPRRAQISGNDTRTRHTYKCLHAGARREPAQYCTHAHETLARCKAE